MGIDLYIAYFFEYIDNFKDGKTYHWPNLNTLNLVYSSPDLVSYFQAAPKAFLFYRFPAFSSIVFE